jgi:hypothetical protein
MMDCDYILEINHSPSINPINHSLDVHNFSADEDVALVLLEYQSHFLDP